jgi:hypothetical protein
MAIYSTSLLGKGKLKPQWNSSAHQLHSLKLNTGNNVG